MANNQKAAKKVATKTAKVHGAPKVPKYEQRETSSTLEMPITKPGAKSKK